MSAETGRGGVIPEQAQEAIKLLYSASRMARMVADDHDRCVAAAKLLKAYVDEQVNVPEPAESEEEA